MADKGKKQVAQRWYLGGIASAGAACGTHPLDLLKVNHHVLLMNYVIILTVGTFTNSTSCKTWLCADDS